MNDSLHKLLAERRRQLGMPIGALVKRSGRSRATVCRILKGTANPLHDNLVAVATALGVELGPETRIHPIEDMLKAQAERKAKFIMKRVKGTMALEAQGIDAEFAFKLFADTFHKALTLPRKRLWYI
jgi:transcriptional regulator with XRE-family HTH domain